MQENKMQIEVTIDKCLLLDILSTGIDESCRNGYWGQIEQYKWYWWYVLDENGEPTDKANPDLTADTVLCRIRDDEDGMAENENRTFVDITLGKLEEAFGWALKNYPHTISPYDIEGNAITDCNYDANTGDIILQRIVFGDIVYG